MRGIEKRTRSRKEILMERAALELEHKRQNPNYITDNERINMARHHVVFDRGVMKARPFERLFNR